MLSFANWKNLTWNGCKELHILFFGAQLFLRVTSFYFELQNGSTLTLRAEKIHLDNPGLIPTWGHLLCLYDPIWEAEKSPFPYPLKLTKYMHRRQFLIGLSSKQLTTWEDKKYLKGEVEHEVSCKWKKHATQLVLAGVGLRGHPGYHRLFSH